MLQTILISLKHKTPSLFLYYNYRQMKGFIIIALIIATACSFQVIQVDSDNELSTIPTKMFAGEIHYSRIPVQYWEHRIQMVKALGLNALSIYIMWNYHEIEKGKFDYQTENKNLSLFLDLAQKYDMKVLFRPGPYVCAQWDFGGLPARLLNINNLVIRANNQPFLEQVKIYFQSLVPIINKHLQTATNPKGSIVLLQIQNQYGFYGNDKSYIEALRKIWYDLNVICDQYYVDWVENIQKCHWTGANIGINNAISQPQFDYVRTFERKGYLLGGEIYSGWLTHWGEKWQSKTIEKNELQYGFLMTYNHSYSMYMVHGGTNFGLTAGANAYTGEKFDYRGHVTSYDYDAPINQQGSSTPKYQALKELIKKHVNWTVPAEPSPIKMIAINRFTLAPTASMLSNLGNAVISSSLKYYMFETNQLQMFNQGFVVYETTTKQRTSYFQAIVHDYALVFLDGVWVATLDRSENVIHNFRTICQQTSCVLRIVVQAMGHINFDHQMEQDYKGLIDINDDIATSFQWNMYKIPVDANILKWTGYTSSKAGAPTLLKATINLSQAGDTYLDAGELTKGYVWVNGRNLGRYWKKGPQSRLFCPGVWLKTGENTIYVLDLHFDGSDRSLSGKTTLQ